MKIKIVYWQSVPLQTTIPLFSIQNTNQHLLQPAMGHFKAILMSHRPRDSEDSTNIRLNGSSLPPIRLPRHPALQSASESFSAGQWRSHLPPAGVRPEVGFQKKFQIQTKYLQEAFRRVYSLVLPYLPSVCIKDLWSPLTYSTLVELRGPSLGVTSVWCCIATQEKGILLCWKK